jgi:hypothetical protein
MKKKLSYRDKLLELEYIYIMLKKSRSTLRTEKI